MSLLKKILTVFVTVFVFSSPIVGYAQQPTTDAKEKTRILESMVKDFRDKNYSSIKQKYIALIELTPDKDGKDEIRLEIAMIDFSAGQEDDALEQVTQLLQRNDLSAHITSAAYATLGDIYRWQKEYPKALVEYKKATAIQGTSAGQKWDVKFKVYRMLLSNKDFDGARKELKEANSIEGIPAWKIKSADNSIGLTYLLEGRYDKAREQFDKVSDIDFESLSPDDVGVFFAIYQRAQLSIGESYFLEKNYPEARKVYEKLLSMSNIDSDTKTEAQEKVAEINLLEKK